MDEDIRAAFDAVLDEMRRGFVEVDRRFATVMDEIRRNGVLIEDLRKDIQVVAEGNGNNERAIDRLRAEMHERFRENEIVVGDAFRQIRRDIDELRQRR